MDSRLKEKLKARGVSLSEPPANVLIPQEFPNYWGGSRRGDAAAACCGFPGFTSLIVALMKSNGLAVKIVDDFVRQNYNGTDYTVGQVVAELRRMVSYLASKGAMAAADDDDDEPDPRITAAVTVELDAWVRRVAFENRQTISEIVVQALEAQRARLEPPAAVAAEAKAKRA